MRRSHARYTRYARFPVSSEELCPLCGCIMMDGACEYCHTHAPEPLDLPTSGSSSSSSSSAAAAAAAVSSSSSSAAAASSSSSSSSSAAASSSSSSSSSRALLCPAPSTAEARLAWLSCCDQSQHFLTNFDFKIWTLFS
eukprot:g73872.t1